MADQKKKRSARAHLAQALGPDSNWMEGLKALLSWKPQQRRFELTEDHLFSVLLARRARSSILGEDLFSDPAWDILLELYAAKLGGRTMSLAELALSTGTPVSTAMRWAAALNERGLTKSRIDPSQPQTVLISLTADAEAKLRHLMDHWGSAFVSI